MSTRTVKLPLVNTDAGSRLIGYLASQQRLAYNHAVHVLNREPSIPKRATTGSSYGLNKRTTAWRNQDPKARHAPYHIHQQGSEAAHLANQGLIESRIKRLERIEAAHARGNQPHPSDARPHRSTLARRSRKHGTQTLTIRARQFIKPIGRYTFTVTGVDHVFRVRRPLPDNILAMQFVEIPDRRRSVNAPLHAIPYELHVAVDEEGPEPSELDNVPLEHYDGMDDGVKNHWTFSNGEQFSFVEPTPNRSPAPKGLSSTRRGKRKAFNQHQAEAGQRALSVGRPQCRLHIADDQHPLSQDRTHRFGSTTKVCSSLRFTNRGQALHRSGKGLSGVTPVHQHVLQTEAVSAPPSSICIENVRPAAMCIREDKSLANMTRSALPARGRPRAAFATGTRKRYSTPQKTSYKSTVRGLVRRRADSNTGESGRIAPG